MPVVRLDTYKASAYLVWQLKHAGAVVHEDGGDIIHVRIPSGEQVSIHLIESIIPAYEVRSTLTYNAANNRHTLLLLWADMLLPPEGHIIEVQEWEWALLALYGERIWAYAVYGGEVFVYPVHYDPYGPYREIRYGKTVSMRHLMGVTVETFSPHLTGRWRVVDFGERTHHAHHKHYQDGATSTQMPDSLAACYALLGIDFDAEPEDVKTAYRNLARKIHPDVNRAANATAQMQALNDAYRRIMEDFEEDA
jgi:hypothetical protein